MPQLFPEPRPPLNTLYREGLNRIASFGGYADMDPRRRIVDLYRRLWRFTENSLAALDDCFSTRPEILLTGAWLVHRLLYIPDRGGVEEENVLHSLIHFFLNGVHFVFSLFGKLSLDAG